MKVLQGIVKYIAIVLIGVSLAFFVARIEYDTNDLSASVLSLTEQDFFESTKRDAWYKKEGETFEVFLAEQVRNEWNLTISILYSPTNIEWYIDSLETPYSVSNIQQNQWNLTLNIQWYENGDLTEWIFQIPYSWSIEDVTLEYIKSKNLDFAIWSLDNIEDSSH